ncbi:LOW QUALITY PROTEIN: endosome-associated-trafficking regulator 1-like [Podargus strigoides]
MSQLLGISRAMERVSLESQGLEDDEDDVNNNDKFSYPCHSASPPAQCKSCDSLGHSQVEDLEELIPSSLNPRYSNMVEDEGVKNRIYAERLAKYALELKKEDQDFQEPFYKDMEMPGSLSKDEDHSWTYHLPVHQRSHVLPTASMAPCGSYDPLEYGVGKHTRADAFAPWAHASDPYLGYSECTRGAELHTLPEEAMGDREFPFLQLPYDRLREENAMLRKVVSSLQSSLESQACTVQRLEKQVKARLAKEKREAQELQSFLQWIEWNFQLMTQRALAESNVEKLHEIFILQGELESSKMENKNLRAGQTTDLRAVEHNIDVALQNLHKITMGANWFIRQLTSGVESLHFVAEVLKSTGKISEVEAEKEL